MSVSFTSEQLDGTVPVPEVYLEAAKLVRLRLAHYSYDAVQRAVLGIFPEDTSKKGDLVWKYISQYSKLFKTSPWFEASALSPSIAWDRKMRIKSLHYMAENCRMDSVPIPLT